MSPAPLLQTAIAEGGVAKRVTPILARGQAGSRALPEGHSAGADSAYALQTLLTGQRDILLMGS